MIGDKPGDKEGVRWNTVDYYLHGEERAAFLSGQSASKKATKPSTKQVDADGDDIPF
jgi:hypothetical protein